MGVFRAERTVQVVPLELIELGNIGAFRKSADRTENVGAFRAKISKRGGGGGGFRASHIPVLP